MKDEKPYTGPIPDHIRDLFEEASKVNEAGSTVYFKFTCAKCGSRQTFPEPNSFYITGECEECKHVTDLFKPEAKVNFMVITRFG